MNTLRQFARLLHIYWIFLTYGLDELLFDIPSLKPFHFLRKLNFFRFSHHKKSRAARLRLALEKLGPIFVKFGQTLSTRRDLLPDDIANELAKLQDNVPPFSSSLAKKKIEQSLGKSVKELFKNFETTPLAAASIAQVHAAELWTGEQVIVKVLRPHIEMEIQRDLHLLYFLAKSVTFFSPALRRLRPTEVVAEFDQIIHDELDLAREAANASQLKRNFEHSPLLYVPQVYWDYITQEVLVIERINGIPISDIETLKKKNVNLKRLAENGVEIFFTQVFRDNFFHADMHPGNIFVDASDPEEPRYVGVDFGIMGALSSQDQRYLAENLLAFFHRDYRRVAELHLSSGWVPPHTRVEQLEAAIRTVCEPIFQKPLNEISFGQMLLKLFHIARRFDMVVQPQLVLLQKTLFNIEGLGRQLYPELDLWATAQPFLERWMQEQVGLKGILHKIRKNLPYWLEKLPDLPELVYQQLQPKENLEYAHLEAQLERLQQKSRYLTYALCLLGIALGTLFYLL